MEMENTAVRLSSLWRTGTTIDLQAEWIASKRQQSWWSGLEAKYKEVTVEAAVPQDGKLRVEGRFSHAWDLPGWGRAWTDQRIVFTVEEADAKAPAITILRLSGRLELEGDSIPFETSPDLLDFHRFVAQGPASHALSRLLDDGSGSRDARLQLIPSLGLWLQTDYALLLMDSKAGAVVHQWRVRVPDLELGNFKSPLRDLELRIMREFGKDMRGATYHFSAAARIRLDQDYGVRIAFSTARSATVFIQAEAGKAFPGPAGMMEALGFQEAAGQLGAAIANVPLLNSFRLEQVHLHLNLQEQKFLGFGLFGNFMLQQYKVHFSFQHPHPTLNARLDAETPIPVFQLLKEWTGSGDLLPSNMKVSRLDLRLGIQPFVFGFGMELTEVWKFEMGDVPIELRALRLRMERDADAQWSGSLGGELLIGGIDFNLTADRMAGAGETGGAWQFRGWAATEEAIQLDVLARWLGDYFQFDVPASFPKIALRDFFVEFHTGTKDFRLAAKASLEEPLGPVQAADLELEFAVTKKAGSSDSAKQRELHLKLEGSASIHHPETEEAWTLQLHVDLGKPEWKLEGSWQADEGSSGLNLLHLGRWADSNADFTDVSAAVQEALTLTEVHLGYYHSATPAFVASARTKGGQEARLLVAHTQEGPGGAFAIGYEQPADAPEFGSFLSIGGRPLVLENAWLMFSWMPRSDGKGLPAQVTGMPFPVKVEDLGKGLAFAAVLDLKNDSSGSFTHLSNASKETRFSLLGRLGTEGISLGLQWQGELRFPTQTAGQDLVISDVGVKLELGPSKFRIAAQGSIAFYLDRYLVQSTVQLDLSLESVDLKLFAKVPDGGIELLGLRDVHIHELWLLLGIGFARGSVRIGFGGKMTFREGQEVKDELGAIIEIVGGVPKPSFISVYITRIDLMDLIRALQSHSGTDYVQQNLIGAEGLSFQWADQKVELPDGTLIQPGTSFHGLFHIMDWKAYLSFRAYLGTGIQATGAFDPITVDGFKFIGTGEAVTLMGTGFGKNWKAVTNLERVPSDVRLTPREVIRKGGAFIRFDSQKSPYFACAFELHILDASMTKGEVEITKDGVLFDFVSVLDSIYSFDLHVRVKGIQHFRAEGKFRAGPHVKILGHHVGVEAVGELEIQGGTETAFKLHWKGGYQVFGGDFGSMVVDIPKVPGDFKEVVDLALHHFMENLTVFKLGRLVVELTRKTYAAHGGRMIQNPLAWTMTWVGNLRDQLAAAEKIGSQHFDPGLKEMRLALFLGDFLEQLKPVIAQQSEAEAQRLRGLNNSIDDIHNARVVRGLRRMEEQMATIKQEVEDLADAQHELRDAISAIWDRHQEDFERAFSEMVRFEDRIKRVGHSPVSLARATKAHMGWMQELNGIRTRIRQEFQAFHRRRGPSRQVSPVALRHFDELEYLRRISMFESRAIIEEARAEAERLRDEFLKARGGRRENIMMNQVNG
jgi:hypothetical protein